MTNIRAGGAHLRVLGFGTYDTRKHPRIGILLDGFRVAGDDVIEANSPLGFSTAERVAMLGKPWLAHRLVRRCPGPTGGLSADELVRLSGPGDSTSLSSGISATSTSSSPGFSFPGLRSLWTC